MIIDVWMPELNGLEVQLILHMIAPATPVIIMTAQERSWDGSHRVYPRRAVAFFAKPFSDDLFLEAVNHALPAVE